MSRSDVIKLIKILVTAGNIIFILWILVNGINENFSGTRVEVVSSIGLISLLILNTVLLYRKA